MVLFENLAYIHLRRFQYDAARDLFEASLRVSDTLEPTPALAAGELHDATQFFRNAVHLDPDQSEYHRELGIVEMRNPRWQKSAEESLRRAIELEQTDARAFAYLGQMYQKNGLKRRAIEAYQMALEWDPEHEMAQEGLAALEEPTDSGRKGLFRRS